MAPSPKKLPVHILKRPPTRITEGSPKLLINAGSVTTGVSPTRVHTTPSRLVATPIETGYTGPPAEHHIQHLPLTFSTLGPHSPVSQLSGAPTNTGPCLVQWIPSGEVA